MARPHSAVLQQAVIYVDGASLMPNPTPTWGNFIFHADQGRNFFRVVVRRILRLHAYYHIEQAVENIFESVGAFS